MLAPPPPSNLSRVDRALVAFPSTQSDSPLRGCLYGGVPLFSSRRPGGSPYRVNAFGRPPLFFFWNPVPSSALIRCFLPFLIFPARIFFAPPPHTLPVYFLSPDDVQHTSCFMMPRRHLTHNSEPSGGLWCAFLQTPLLSLTRLL